MMDVAGVVMATEEQKASAALRIKGPIAFVVLSNPPTNALSDEMRATIYAHVETADADPSVSAIVLVGRGQRFSAGMRDADLDRPQAFPDLNTLCNRIEMCSKPVVAALTGAISAEGAALALAAHYRIMEKNARISFSDAHFALVPAGGVTQRLPRLIGIEAALAVLLPAATIPAASAQEMGLVDLVASQKIRVAAINFARERLAEGGQPRRVRDMDRVFSHPQNNTAAIAEARRTYGQRSFAANRIIDCVEATMLLPFEAGLGREEVERNEALASPQSIALRHAHVSERRAARPHGFTAADARPVATLGLSGASNLALGLCLIALDHGVRVRFLAPTAEIAQATLSKINHAYDVAETKGQVTADQKQSRLDSFFVSADPASFADCDAVIEATTGTLDARVNALLKVETALNADTPLATVSDRAVEQMAGKLAHPERFCATHIFAPAQVIRLVELGRAPATNAATLATFHKMLTSMGKRVVSVQARDGFVANRVQEATLQAVDVCLLLGATPAQIDAAMTRFGFATAPCAMMDRIGLEHFSGTVAQALVAAGLASVSGRGFFDADGTDVASLEVIGLLREAGEITPMTFTDSELIKRIVLAQANAGVHLLEQGVVEYPFDIDVIMMLGKGFPRHHGGPMQWADQLTLFQAEKALKRYASTSPEVWAPATLWRELVKSGESFKSLNATR
ncbi:enoyl-CoA hydratase-related protein [Celeribacter sp.]|uniref:enoyl-CoA hydratase-related protein n=1 Tax=Celeribacter sp. TaxID=1890673 RepID=UPI003A955B15